MTDEPRITVWKGCAHDVASAVKIFCDRWGPYSTKSSHHSIFSLFGELIDPAFAAYLATLPDHHPGRWLFSETSITKLARQGGFGLPEKVIRFFLRQYTRMDGHDVEYEATLETVQEVARRCRTKRPNSLPSRRANRLYSEYCEFCGAHTELSAKEKGCTRPGYDGEGAARLSGKYCWDHRPKYLDGSRNDKYLRAARHKREFEIELGRLILQASAPSKPNAATGASDLDLFYFRLLTPYPVYPSDVCFLRNEARQIVDSRVNDQKKRIVMMRSNRYALSAIAEKVSARSRQAVAKTLGSIPKWYRFDLASDAANNPNIENLFSTAEKFTCSKIDPETQIQFMGLIGPAAAAAFQDSDIAEILLNDDGSLWAISRTVGMKNIGSISASNAEQIVQFVGYNFNQECAANKHHVMAKIPFANARFTGVLPPTVDRSIFGIRKGANPADVVEFRDQIFSS